MISRIVGEIIYTAQILYKYNEVDTNLLVLSFFILSVYSNYVFDIHQLAFFTIDKLTCHVVYHIYVIKVFMYYKTPRIPTVIQFCTFKYIKAGRNILFGPRGFESNIYPFPNYSILLWNLIQIILRSKVMMIDQNAGTNT